MKQWNDWDGAAYKLGLTLGLFDKQKHSFQTGVKHVFWTANPVGKALHECLESLVGAGVLLGRGDIDEEVTNGSYHSVYTQFKWNPEFFGSWEKDTRTPLQALTEGVYAED